MRKVIMKKTNEILSEIKTMSSEEKRNISYEQLKEMISPMTPDEIIELSNIIGYPVFTRMCMGDLRHKFVLLQDGASAIILNNKGQILLQSRADRDKWGLPGGCQELGERIEETMIREIKEETNLDVLEKDLELIALVTGPSRRNDYPNGDIVINNTALFCVRNYTGELKWDEESKDMKFFEITNLPKNSLFIKQKRGLLRWGRFNKLNRKNRTRLYERKSTKISKRYRIFTRCFLYL